MIRPSPDETKQLQAVREKLATLHTIEHGQDTPDTPVIIDGLHDQIAHLLALSLQPRANGAGSEAPTKPTLKEVANDLAAIHRTTSAFMHLLPKNDLSEQSLAFTLRHIIEEYVTAHKLSKGRKAIPFDMAEYGPFIGVFIASCMPQLIDCTAKINGNTLVLKPIQKKK